MPLEGEAKKAYQQEYMRGYMQTKRAVKTPSVSLRPVKTPLRPVLDPLVRPKAEIISQLRELIKPVEKKQEEIPLYNPAVHRAGDKVRVWQYGKLVVIVIPELDADGQPVPQGASSTSLSSTFNLMKPTFNPDPKPVKKVRSHYARIRRVRR